MSKFKQVLYARPDSESQPATPSLPRRHAWNDHGIPGAGKYATLPTVLGRQRRNAGRNSGHPVFPPPLARPQVLGLDPAGIHVYGRHRHGLLPAPAAGRRHELEPIIRQNIETFRLVIFLGCPRLCRAAGRAVI